MLKIDDWNYNKKKLCFQYFSYNNFYLKFKKEICPLTFYVQKLWERIILCIYKVSIYKLIQSLEYWNNWLHYPDWIPERVVRSCKRYFILSTKEEILLKEI